jgi:hypothetical protein
MAKTVITTFFVDCREFGGNVYLIVHKPREGFFEAEAFCQGLGGHLASVHSPTEYSFIKSFSHP